MRGFTNFISNLYKYVQSSIWQQQDAYRPGNELVFVLTPVKLQQLMLDLLLVTDASACDSFSSSPFFTDSMQQSYWGRKFNWVQFIILSFYMQGIIYMRIF